MSHRLGCQCRVVDASGGVSSSGRNPSADHGPRPASHQPHQPHQPRRPRRLPRLSSRYSMNVTLRSLFRVYCHIHPLNSHLNVIRRGADDETATHVTALAAPERLPASAPCCARSLTRPARRQLRGLGLSAALCSLSAGSRHAGPMGRGGPCGALSFAAGGCCDLCRRRVGGHLSRLERHGWVRPLATAAQPLQSRARRCGMGAYGGAGFPHGGPNRRRDGGYRPFRPA